jgi:hypothetical protein
MAKNKFGKTVKVDSPYAIYKNESTEFEHRVLKTYQTKDNESKNPYARWYVASRSPYTYGSWEYGDIYVKDVISYHDLIAGTDEWKKDYEFIEKCKEKVLKNIKEFV